MKNEIYLSFEWDPNKNRINIIKHEVSFIEASTVFYDEKMIIENDLEHSNEEERFIALGMSNKLNILIVCHCAKESKNKIRIISARKANKKEIERYKVINNL